MRSQLMRIMKKVIGCVMIVIGVGFTIVGVDRLLNPTSEENALIDKVAKYGGTIANVGSPGKAAFLYFVVAGAAFAASRALLKEKYPRS